MKILMIFKILSNLFTNPMSLPNSASIEIPILQELSAVGGEDKLRFIYERLIPYFPQLTETQITEIKQSSNKNWRNTVQKAGKILDKKKLILRKRGNWTLTEKGFELVQKESSGFTLTKNENKSLSHVEIQEMLVKIGEELNFYAETEFEYYDVIWREKSKSVRLSHIFEVQSKGNLDSAFAKLKRAYEAQRTKPFLIVSNEKNLRRAIKSLNYEFRDLESAVKILTFAQVEKVYQNLTEISEILPLFLEN